MKYFFLLAALILFRSYTYSQQIAIPFVLKDGYGPFHYDISTHTIDIKRVGSIYEKCFPVLKGIPTDWHSIKQGIIEVIPWQFNYQKYCAGQLSESQLDTLMKGWQQIVEKEKIYTKRDINSYLNIVYGFDSTTEKYKAIIDKNHNNDLTDDTAFIVPFSKDIHDEKQMFQSTVLVNFARYTGQEVRKETAHLLLETNSYGILMIGFAQYGKAEWNGYNLYIDPRFFMSLSYHSSNLIIGKNISDTDEVHSKNFIAKNQFFNIDNKEYKFSGVDIINHTIHIEQKKKSDSVSNQIGFSAPPIYGLNVLNNDSINIKNIHKKYVFVDFWGTWCEPCLAQIPDIEKLYNQVDTSKVEFIGLCKQSKKEDVLKDIHKYNLKYPNVLSNSMIEEDYGVDAVPQNYLIDENGVIVNKDIPIDSLSAFLKKENYLNK